MFDFKIVQRQIITAYRRVDIESWSLEEVIDFFAMYYSKYQQATGREHPRLTTATIEKIISELPYLYIRDEYRCCGYMKGMIGHCVRFAKNGSAAEIWLTGLHWKITKK